MFGYIVPYREELKLKDYKEYKNAYCELCNGLKKNYRRVSMIFLNYEVTFLYILLDSIGENSKEMMSISCGLNPMKKCKRAINPILLDYVSFINMYLVIMKLDDDYKDERKLFRKVIASSIKKSKKYKNNLLKYEILHTKIETQLQNFSKYEKENCNDFDKISDCMGNILRIIIEYYFEYFTTDSLKINSIRLKEISYHLGKWLYLIDAVDDFEKDIKKTQYNPLNSFVRKEDEGVKKMYQKAHIMLRLMEKNMIEQNQYIDYQRHKAVIYNIFFYGLEQKVNQILCKKKL